MSEKKFVTSEQQTYCFAFGSDEKLHKVSFQGNLPNDVTDMLLEAAGEATYEKAGDSIRAYLEKQYLKYSNFEFKESYLNHQKVMEWANTLLHSDASTAIDASIGIADHYYGVMDYQKWTQNDQCEGCYLAIRRNIADKNFKSTFKHNIIGQTFIYNDFGD